MKKQLKKSEICAKKFLNLLLEGKIRKNILPNTSLDYTESAEKRDLVNYKNFINSSIYDDFSNCEVRKYNADE